jgi:hypothetical protein
MDALPFTQKLLATSSRLGEQTPHVRPPDANTEHNLRPSGGTKEIDFRLSRARDMNMGRLVIERVDNEPEAERAMDDHHDRI